MGVEVSNMDTEDYIDVTVADKRQVAEWVQQCLCMLRCGSLRIDIQWNRKFTRRMGDARYDFHAQCGRVRFSYPLWPRATYIQRYETTFHEVCHIVAAHLHGRKQGHGRVWQDLMRECGLTPERCHTVDRTGLKRTTKTVVAHCACAEHMLTPKRARTAWMLQCMKCKTSVKLGTMKGKV